MTSGKIFLAKDIQDSLREIQKGVFGIIEDLKAQDSDVQEQLKLILKDDTLANAFKLFQENKSKAIRKKILDIMGDANRQLIANLEDYDVDFTKEIELKGIVK